MIKHNSLMQHTALITAKAHARAWVGGSVNRTCTARDRTSHPDYRCSTCLAARMNQNLLLGKIQGDGRKRLDHLKSYFGSQISSQSLSKSISTDCSQNPQQKVILVYIFVFDCQFESAARVAL